MDKNKSLPLVTIAMVTYNSEKYIHQAIQSVLCQSYDNLELIIGDDVSADSTWEIIQSYKDKRIRTYRNEKNLTQYPNRNKALERAEGKYIIYIDGDDIIYPHGLEFMVKMLDSFPECGMALMYWHRNNLIFPVVMSTHQFFTAEFFHKGFIPTALSNVLFNVALFKKVGGFPNDHISSDIMARFNVALKAPSLIINDNLTWWRETPGQQSSKVSNTLKGTIESFQQRQEILMKSDSFFNSIEKDEAMFNIERSMFWIGINSLIKLNFKMLSEVWPYFSFRLKYLIKDRMERDPFQEFTTSKPYMLNFEKNPFSKIPPEPN
jgi:glycosyltransferase involved in cell wall biosynthesis